MVYTTEIDREATCPHCGETHSDFYKEHYDNNSALTPIYVCPRCNCGDDYWKL